jgi:predicted amidohydrolase
MQPTLGDFAGNLAKMIQQVETVMHEAPQTQLIIFPELITSGYECQGDFQALAETVEDGTSIQEMGQVARKFGVHIVYGFPERDSDLRDVLYNSAILLDADGSPVGVYRKVHLFASEKEFFRPGCSYPLFQTAIGKLGIMICWDTAFPEVARSYALQGADLLVVSTNWEKAYLPDLATDNEADWDLVTRARALDNCIYLAAANRIGDDKTLGFFGRSKIIGPTGVPLAQLDEEREGMITAELDYAIPLELRHRYYTFFRDRRPDTYGQLVREY